VLQRRKAAQRKVSEVAASSAPIFNLSLGNDFLHSTNNIKNSSRAPDSLSLLDPSRTAGPDMPIATFCTRYELGDLILRKLIDNGYSHACMLRFVQITELTQMEFRLGDIAAMKDAVEQWSVSTGN
jgi:hypothetical protein